MPLLIIVRVLVGCMLVGLIVFLYMLGNPRPNEPGLIRRIRLQPSAVGEYAALFAHGIFHPHLLRSGATRHEMTRALPGDELVPSPRWQETRAITIDVPAAEVWPWIVQMGGGRAGWYWWVPLSVYPEWAKWTTSSFEILPQFQQLKVGDALSDGGPAATAERGNWIVMAIEPNRHLVLYAGRQVTEGPDFDPEKQKPKGMWFVCGWAFVLEPIGENQTRLMVRVRAVGGPAWLFLAMRLIFGYGDTVAHSTMLQGIKERAEGRYAVQGS